MQSDLFYQFCGTIAFVIGIQFSDNAQLVILIFDMAMTNPFFEFSLRFKSNPWRMKHRGVDYFPEKIDIILEYPNVMGPGKPD